jgi:hypothetical protein
MMPEARPRSPESAGGLPVMPEYDWIKNNVARDIRTGRLAPTSEGIARHVIREAAVTPTRGERSPTDFSPTSRASCRGELVAEVSIFTQTCSDRAQGHYTLWSFNTLSGPTPEETTRRSTGRSNIFGHPVRAAGRPRRGAVRPLIKQDPTV